MLNYIINYLFPKVFAQTFKKPSPLQNFTIWDNFKEVMSDIPKLLRYGGYTLAFIAILVGGIMYLSSFGNEEQATRAKDALFAAAAGIVIIIIGEVAARFYILTIGQ